MNDYNFDKIVLKASIKRYIAVTLPLLLMLFCFYQTIKQPSIPRTPKPERDADKPTVNLYDATSVADSFSDPTAALSMSRGEIPTELQDAMDANRQPENTTPPPPSAAYQGPLYSILSFISFLLFICVWLTFRFKKYFPIPSKTRVLAPINGKVIETQKIAEGYIITIQKPFFASAEVVTATKADIPYGINTDLPNVCWEVSGMFASIYIEDTIPYQASLVGVAPGKATCDMFIPAQFQLTVSKNARLRAGETTVAKEIEDTWLSKPPTTNP